MDDARRIIETLALSAHPEGGWYRETWRGGGRGGGAREDGRAGASAILFLLEAGQRSHWHRVDADEIWLWHGGAPILLETAASDADAPETIRLGADILAGETPQHRVPAGHWQAATGDGGWALVSCVVAPAFEFDGFTLAPEGFRPGG